MLGLFSLTTSFETVGNATLITYDSGDPLLATDIWYEEDSAYFGSWRLSHHIKPAQRKAILKAKYIFISHFHPDHLNISSLKRHKHSTILVGSHYGRRIVNDLKKAGFKVIELENKKWVRIGSKTRIFVTTNELHDSALLVELEDNVGNLSLLLNLNDSDGRGFRHVLSEIAKKYSRVIYLALHGWGDADMINLFTSDGTRVTPIAAQRIPIGPQIQERMEFYNARYAIPFSSFHQYQRSDSWWANAYTTPWQNLSDGFISSQSRQLLNPFQNCLLQDSSIFFKQLPIEPVVIDQPISTENF